MWEKGAPRGWAACRPLLMPDENGVTPTRLPQRFPSALHGPDKPGEQLTPGKRGRLLGQAT